MSAYMSPRQRVLAVMAGEIPDRIPFIIWNNKMPSGSLGQQLLDRGVCVINKSRVYRFGTPSISTKMTKTQDTAGIERTCIEYHTNSGILSSVQLRTHDLTWTEKMIFSGPQDYEPLHELIQSRVYSPCYQEFIEDNQTPSEQALARPQTIHSPTQELLYWYMGIETFCIEWMERRDRVLQLCKTLETDNCKRIELLAESPAHYVIVEGNVDPKLMGPDYFKQHCLPHIQYACDILHAKGKYVGAHLDSDNRLIAPLVAETSLDLIESFTPPPDCEFSIAEARRHWPNKTLMLNFPASVHHSGSHAVQEVARHLLHECKPGGHVIFGICEDLPDEAKSTLVPLVETIETEGKTPLI